MITKLRDFLTFQDRDKYMPFSGDFVVARAFKSFSHSEPDEPDWVHEEWAVRSVLIGLDDRASARDSFDCAGIRISPWWMNKNEFDFGLKSEISGIMAESFYVEREHPLNKKLLVELRQDFIIYHGLDRSEPDDETIEYRHVLDDIPVARIELRDSLPYSPTPLITVHTDYLRDYLASRHSALVVCQVSDRVANSASLEDFGIRETDRHIEGQGVWLQNVVSCGDEHHPVCRARVTLWRNIIIEPYDAPKPHRGPWSYGFEGAESSAKFVIDAEGNTAVLDDIKQLYLFFRRDVLSRFLTTPGYSVWFHMRHWGAAGHPGDKSVDVGINEEGYVTAFAPDLRKLAPRDQTYWSSYTIRPIGGVCEELWQTRMQLDPPDAPGVCELIENAMTALDGAFRDRYGSALYKAERPANRELATLTVGPLHDRYEDLFPLAKTLYQLTIETMTIDSLRKPLKAAGIQYDTDKDRQLNLLDLLGEKLLKISANEVALLTRPLRGLNKLRQSDAHLGRADFEKAFAKLGSPQVPQSPITAWNVLIDAVAGALQRMTDCLG
ncbi:MAG TPA: hypothetical protein VMW69_05565 [Spirochaetia bacterium]|nr:hypothetical protein [Spirochaetia bacterium]